MEGQFNKLTQSGKVDDYITKFEELKKHMVAQNPNLGELYFVNSFLSGLKEEIASALYRHKPNTLRDAREKARAQECVIEALERKSKQCAKQSSGSSFAGKKEGTTSGDRTKTPYQNGNKQVGRAVKRLSYGDFKERMSKGLCIHCGEKYSPGHNCKNKQVFMLATEDDTEGATADTGDLSLIWGDCDEEVPTKEVESELSIHALTGTDGVHTLSVKGETRNRALRILIDSGSSHSFVPTNLVKALQLKTQLCTSVNVIVANGEKLTSCQQLEKFEWKMAGESFVAPMLALPIGSYDVILRVTWMKLVSPVIFNFQQDSIMVSWEGRRLN